MQSLSLHNDGVKYLLTCFDTFSKYAWVRPLKNKSGLCVKEAFESLLREKAPLYLQTDKGTELKNILFQSQLAEYEINFYTSEKDDMKAAIMERFNRTLKTRMYRYFTHSKSSRYVDVLQDLVQSYNHTYHSSIGMAPTSVNFKNERVVRQKLFHKHPEKPKLRFDTGRRVRISKLKQAYLPGWSEEIFIISKKCPTTPVTYAIKDVANEEIKGRFYEPELQLIIKEDNVYDVEKVLKTTRRNGKIQYYVKWKGYPDKFNSWIDSCSLVSANVGKKR